MRDNVVSISIKVMLGLCVLGYMSSLLGKSEEKHLMAAAEEEVEENSSTLSEDVIVSTPIKRIILQPHCDTLDSEISLHLIILESFSCKPEDAEKEKAKMATSTAAKKKKSRKSQSETTESMVVYVAVGLLLVSLGAALLEVFKFVNQPAVKTKPALNRSCSLADLTVMRHNRKELMRRDSMLEGGSGNWETRASSKQLGRKVSRPLLRLE